MGAGTLRQFGSQSAFTDVFAATFGTSDNGRWQADSGGSTTSSDTGPGTNNVLAFVHTETSGSSEDVTTLENNGIATMAAAEIPDQADRTLRLRLCIQGQFGDGTEGMRIDERAADGDVWAEAGFVHGWDYGSAYVSGGTATDENGVTITFAADGGWVDFDIDIADSTTQVRLVPKYVVPVGGTSYTHDVAVRELRWSWTDPPPEPVVEALSPTFTDRELLLAGDLESKAGLRLLDLQGNLIEDISGDVMANTAIVERTHPSHGSAMAKFRCRLSRSLPWTEVLLAPYMTVTDRFTGRERIWDMGVYLPEAPGVKRASEVFAVEAFDLLEVYDTRITASFRADVDDNVIEAVRTFCSNEDRWPGYSFSFAFGANNEEFAYERSWPLTENATYLEVANEMLGVAAHRPLWTTRTGEIATEEATLLHARGSEWLIDGAVPEGEFGAGQIGNDSEVDLETRKVSNVWLGIEFNPSADIPTEEAGTIYRVRNVDAGPTSIDTRGREVNKVVTTDAVSKAALAIMVDSVAEADVAASERITLTTGPLPFVWHNTTVTINDPKLGLNHVPAVVRAWRLPQDGGKMELVCDRLYKVVA